MDLRENSILGDIAEEHWYYISKFRAIYKMLLLCKFATFFDIGSGDGFFAKKILSTFADAEEGWCIDTGYENNSSLMFNGKRLFFSISPPKIKPDLYIFIDVLEHIEKDLNFLNEYTTSARAGAHFFFSVPAFPFLWSAHDVFLGHKRRYTLKIFEELIKNSGLNIIASNYFFADIFPIAACMRLFSKFSNKKPRSQLMPHSRLINKLLLYLSLPETAFFRHNRLFGLSILCLAKK